MLTASLLALLTDNLVLGKPPQGSTISIGYVAGICTPQPQTSKVPKTQLNLMWATWYGDVLECVSGA